MRTVSWIFLSPATYQARGRASWTLWNRSKGTHQNFVDMFLRCDVEPHGKAVPTSLAAPSAVKVMSRKRPCTSDCHPYAWHTFAIVGWTIHLLFLTVCGTNQREYLLGASTQPIKIQEEGIPLWPNKGVLIALPQEPSFGRFFAGFGHAWLPSPRRPSSS